MSTSLAYSTVHEACVAFRDEKITEDELIRALVALPAARQAPRPTDSEWYDAVSFKRGPVFQLRHETFDGVISPKTYSRAVKAMLAAGHAA